MKKNTVMLIVLSIFNSSCTTYECAHYKAVLKDKEEVRKREHWADINVFGKKYTMEDYEIDLSIVGPGRRVFNRESGVSIPDFWNGPFHDISRVRALGDDLTQPEAVFLGERSFAGILIARSTIDEMLTKSKISAPGLDGENGRVAAMCRRD